MIDFFVNITVRFNDWDELKKEMDNPEYSYVGKTYELYMEEFEPTKQSDKNQIIKTERLFFLYPWD